MCALLVYLLPSAHDLLDPSDRRLFFFFVFFTERQIKMTNLLNFSERRGRKSGKIIRNPDYETKTRVMKMMVKRKTVACSTRGCLS